jgi:uncharacterized protein YkwD
VRRRARISARRLVPLLLTCVVGAFFPFSVVAGEADSWWRASLRALAGPRLERAIDASVGLGPELDANELRRELHERVNALRREQGRAPLVGDDRLADVALLHSRDMAHRAYFSHRSRDGRETGDRLAERYPEHVGAFAENIYRILSYRAMGAPGEKGPAPVDGKKGYSATSVAARIVRGWMRSPGHRENLLRREMQRVGYGVVINKRDVYVTQLLSRPIVVLESSFPSRAGAGGGLELRLVLGTDLQAVQTVEALLIWPDPKRRVPLSGGRSMLGASPLTIVRSGPRATLQIDVPRDTGAYRVRVGHSGRFYDIGGFEVR